MTALAANPGSALLPADRQQSLALTYHRLMMVMLLFAGVTLLIVARLGAAADPLRPVERRCDRQSAGAGARRHRRPQRHPAGAHHRRLVDRRPSRSACSAMSTTIAAKLAELMPERSVDEYRRDPAIGQDLRLSRAAARCRSWSRRSTRSASRRSCSTASRSGSIRNLELAAHVLGYTDLDGTGDAGIERALERAAVRARSARHAAAAVDRRPRPAGARGRTGARDGQVLARSAPPAS